MSTWIIAALRNQTFFSLKELNNAIKTKLEEFNQKPFQKKTGSRREAFLEEEKFALLPLPAKPYELATWKKTIVPLDYHIVLDKMHHYSVPYEYVKHEVEVRITTNIVEIFFNNIRIASHMRLTGRKEESSTIPEHMPENHQFYMEWDKDYILNWADKVGEHTTKVINAIFTAYKAERQAQKMCMGIIKLADQFSLPRLEEACRQALQYSPSPKLNTIKTILKQGGDKRIDKNKTVKGIANTQQSSPFSFTRGKDYFGGKTK